MSALSPNKHTPADASGGAVTLTLPTGQSSGTEIGAEKIDASSNTVTVTGSIRGVGSSSLVLKLQFEAITFRADSSGSWWPIAGHKTLASLDSRFLGQALLDAPSGVPSLDASTLINPARLPAAPFDVQVFTANGTWTKPSWATACTVVLIGAGGGGGGGAQQVAGTACSGGAGGGGGAFSTRTFQASLLGSTETVTVSATGGAGGSAAAGSNTAGGNGTAGGATTFGAHLKAAGGNAGNGGALNAASTAGAAGSGIVNGGAGGAGNNGTAGSSGGATAGGGGGGGGGGFSAANAFQNGGNGGACTQNTTGGGLGATSAGTAGGAGANTTVNEGNPGSGGGGGAGNTTGAGGAGGAGGRYGAAGGGGGSTQNTQTPGIGGAGGGGIAIVISSTTGTTSFDIAGTVSTLAGKSAILTTATNGTGKRTFTNECAYPIPTNGTPWVASYGTAGTGTTSQPTVATFLTALAAVNGTRTYTHLPAFPAGELVQLMQWTGASSQTGSDTGPSSGPNAAAARYPCSPGDIVSGSIFAGSSVATGLRAAIEWYTSGGSFIGRSLGGLRTFVAGDAYRLHVGGAGSPLAVAPLTAASYAIVARPDLISTFGSTGFLGLWGAQMLHTYQAQPYRNGNHQDAAWSGTTGASASLAHLTAPTRKIALLGDSMAQLAQDGGNPLPDHLAWKLGCEVYNLGRGGETTAGMALRYGALPLMVTVTGGSIPTSGSVNVSVDKATTWRDDALWAFNGTLAGVPGVLTRPSGVTGSGNSWTFTPTVYPGSPLAVPAPTPWRSTQGTDYADITVVIGGNNNESVATGQSYLTSDIVRDYKAIRTRVRANGGRLLILSAYPNSGGTTGTTQATEVAAINSALATEFGAEYLDLLSLMRSTAALAIAGITPTGNDNTDIANGVIPRDLMQVDGIHPNETGRDVEAFFIAQYILAMDWLTAG